MPCSASSFTTTRCVEIPAWSCRAERACCSRACGAARQDVYLRVVEHVADMQRAGHVGRRDDDGEHGPWRFGIGTKQLLLHPGAGPALLDLLRSYALGISLGISFPILSLRASAVARLNRRLLCLSEPAAAGLGDNCARSPSLRPLTSRSHESPIIRADCAGRQMRT